MIKVYTYETPREITETSNMKIFVKEVNEGKPLVINTKPFFLDVARVLDLTLTLSTADIGQNLLDNSKLSFRFSCVDKKLQ